MDNQIIQFTDDPFDQLKNIVAQMKNDPEQDKTKTYKYMFMIMMILDRITSIDKVMRDGYAPVTRGFQNVTIAISKLEKQLNDLLKKVHVKDGKQTTDPVTPQEAKALWESIKELQEYKGKIDAAIAKLYDKDGKKVINVPDSTIENWKRNSMLIGKLGNFMQRSVEDHFGGKEPKTDDDFKALANVIHGGWLANDSILQGGCWIRRFTGGFVDPAGRPEYGTVSGTTQLNTIVTTLNQENNTDISSGIQLTGLLNTTGQNIIANFTAKTIVQNYAPA
jgi:hypothetical protein